MLDAVQSRFLKALDISVDDALMHFSFVPLALDVAIPSMIHRTMLGHSPECLQRFFRLEGLNLQSRTRGLIAECSAILARLTRNTFF